jgi:LCP family protein required for cell wall assembly
MDDTTPEPEDATSVVGPTPRRRRKRVLISLATAFVVIVAFVGGYAFWAKWRVDQALASVRSDLVFEGIDPASRPPESPDGGMTFLIAGSDVVSPDATTGTEAGSVATQLVAPSVTAAPNAGPGRSDVVMLVHVNGDHSKASVISIPRDSLVTIPAYTDATGASHPATQRKINAAFSLGGGRLLVRTVEGLTGLRVDHFAYIDYEGLIKLIDAIGGVDVINLHATSNVYNNPAWTFPAGPIHLNGELARVWVSQRKNMPRSDLDRARNSRILMQAIAKKLASPSVMANPVELQRALDLLSTVATVDETLTPGAMKSLALQLRDINVSSILMRTAPTTGKSLVNGEMVFHLDEKLLPLLWPAVATSDLARIKDTTLA